MLPVSQMGILKAVLALRGQLGRAVRGRLVPMGGSHPSLRKPRVLPYLESFHSLFSNWTEPWCPLMSPELQEKEAGVGWGGWAASGSNCYTALLSPNIKRMWTGWAVPHTHPFCPAGSLYHPRLAWQTGAGGEGARHRPSACVCCCAASGSAVQLCAGLSGSVCPWGLDSSPSLVAGQLHLPRFRGTEVWPRKSGVKGIKLGSALCKTSTLPTMLSFKPQHPVISRIKKQTIKNFR